MPFAAGGLLRGSGRPCHQEAQPIDRNAELHGAGNDGHGGQLSDLAAAGPPMSSKPDPRERGAKGKEMAIRIALAR
ncbi:hypothetical protein LRP30_29090 [Bradyrhizobium sp. C-145]|uniref:hypothetical protein n=1 Tax=Bradyrhizobium sp. C-145 TaxID=574727 RepID=UPI00201B47B5|nr:hypothetical protein [Bradyrhizobium sp. C-145]UQR61014.1 hypothetical protein LRP30_29090 [Bradyrhizobium sp. C-145]